MFENYCEQLWCFVINIFNFDIIFDESWLKKHNFQIDHYNCIIIFNFNYCCVNCNLFFEIVIIVEFDFKLRRKNRKKKFFDKNKFINKSVKIFDKNKFAEKLMKKFFKKKICIKNVNIIYILIYAFLRITKKKNSEIVVL